MASTGVDYAGSGQRTPPPKISNEDIKQSEADKMEEKPAYADEADRRKSTASVEISYDSTHRKLKPRHIQLIGIGGTIGTALYVAIGQGLIAGGPGSLFIAFSLWCSVILAVTLCTSKIHSFPSLLLASACRVPLLCMCVSLSTVPRRDFAIPRQRLCLKQLSSSRSLVQSAT